MDAEIAVPTWTFNLCPGCTVTIIAESLESARQKLERWLRSGK